MQPKADSGGKAIKKLSFCLFCMYSGSNDILYKDHIICSCYHMNYGCGQCLNKVFTTGQQLKAHLKVCTGLPKEAMAKASTENVPNSQVPPSQSSQESSQASLCQSQHTKKKPASTPKNADSIFQLRLVRLLTNVAQCGMFFLVLLF